jgi:hypothetical protein
MGAMWRIFLSAVFVAAATVTGTWYWYLRPTYLNEALKSEHSALTLTSWALDRAPTPEAWDTRAYLPTSSVQQLGNALVGLEFVSRRGRSDASNRYEGAFVIKLDGFSLETDAAQLRPRLNATVRYEADRLQPWWRDAVMQVTIHALFVPVVVEDVKTKARRVRLQVVPTKIDPKVPLGPIGAILAGSLLSKMIAEGVFVRYGEQLTLAAPALSEKIEVELKVDSKSHTDFEKGGSYDLLAKMDGPTFKRTIDANLPLVTSRGIWMLDITGKTLPEPATPPGDAEALLNSVVALRRSVAEKIRLYERTDEVVEVRISNRPLLAIAAEIASPKDPSKYTLAISSANASGKIAEKFLLKDKLLGNVGLTVQPRVPDFVSGYVSFAPPKIGWVAGKGLETTMAATASARASINVHLSTGAIGGGIGKDLDIHGQTTGSVPVSLKVEKRKIENVTALVLQPEVGCTRFEVDLNPSTREDIIKEAWIALKPFGVRVKRNVGGGRQSPSILLSDLPTLQRFGEKKEDAETLKGKRDYLRPKYVEMAWSLEDVRVESDGLFARAGVSVKPRPGDLDIDAVEKEQSESRKQLLDALRETATQVDCQPRDEFALLLLGNVVEIGSDNDVVRMITVLFKEGKHIAEETVKEIEKLYKNPMETIVKAPENVLREASKSVENVTREVSKAPAAVGDAVRGVVCGEICAFGSCRRIC